MNEFSLIDTYFKNPAIKRNDVVFGIGDDAACVQVPIGKQLLVSTDTLVADVHFLQTWDAYDIAFKAVMVNVSDIAAMGGEPCWLSLALTLPTLDQTWLARFSQGLFVALQQYNITLIGGDTTRGPLSMTLTIHGLVEQGKAVRRNGARPGDVIMVSGELGAAALAVSLLHGSTVPQQDNALLLDKLKHPHPRIDLAALLSSYASAAIDISDGLSADLNHICRQSQVSALLNLAAIPVHPLVSKYKHADAIHFALSGGDDYEVCFTLPAAQQEIFMQHLSLQGLHCYPIGTIAAGEGLWISADDGSMMPLTPCGYNHFQESKDE